MQDSYAGRGPRAASGPPAAAPGAPHPTPPRAGHRARRAAECALLLFLAWTAGLPAPRPAAAQTPDTAAASPAAALRIPRLPAATSAGGALCPVVRATGITQTAGPVTGSGWAAGPGTAATYAPPPVPTLAARGDSTALSGLDALLHRYGDLGIQVRGRSSLGGTWRRVEPCSRNLSLRCDPPLIPRLDPEVTFGVVAQGTLAERVHVKVDYDDSREFQAGDQVRISYEGRPGEPLRSVVLGNVALAPPSSSRYLAAAAPGRAMGILATGRLGGMELEALWARHTAEETRREFRRPVGGGAVGQEAQTVLDDAAYAGGQFFFLFDPSLLRGHPHLDIRALAGDEAARELVPQGGVQLYRYSGVSSAPDGSTVLLRASPRESGHGQEIVTGPFRLLAAGVDYQLHPSGLWLALRSPLGEDEALAVIYRSAAGTEVGQVAPPASPGVAREARLLRGLRATHRPGAATWPLEMRHVYPISSTGDLDPASIRLVISRGDPSAGDLSRPHPVNGSPLPYLRLLGLDESSPADQLDPARAYHPAREQVDAVLRGAYLIFPTLRPFAEPPPLPGSRLTAAQAAQALGTAANPDLYTAVDDRDRRAAARFRLGFGYRVRGGQSQSVFFLGSTFIQEGSERVRVGSRQLQRGVDYDILYDLGEVHLRDPGMLSALGPDSELRITFQESRLFPRAPTYVGGVRGNIPLGGAGALSLFAVSQKETSTLRRPPLGAESRALLAGGAAGSLRLGAPWLSRLLPGNDSTPSEFRLAGEVAASMPYGAGRDQAFVDDFEDAGSIDVPLLRHAWRLGSAPAPDAPLAGGGTPHPFDAASAGALVWQHDVREPSGRVMAGVRTAEVDSMLRVTEGGRLSGVLHLGLQRTGAAPAWRSVTTVLSPTGRDLRDQAYLEFYLRGGGPGDALVLDLGTVSEDALALDASGAAQGTDGSGRPWGRGVLDREWDPALEAWTEEHDARGLWGAGCEAQPGASYPLGDALSNCTRNNGVQDTEDLNGNGQLDTDEQAMRVRVPLDDAASPFLVRDSAQTGTGFRLYRVPLRQPGGGVDLRVVRHLRLALVSPNGAQVSLSRMRFTGSTWQKRSSGGVARGLVGTDTLAAGRLEVDHVSRLSEGPGYVSPPGVDVRLQDPRSGRSNLAPVEFSEKSLRLRYAGVGADDRAEVHLPLPQAPRSFLAYRELRLWALAREGRWGDDGERLVVRVGNGTSDHYLYRAPLQRVGAPRTAADWGAEVVIDLERWQALRAQADSLLTAREPGATGPLVVWDADSVYAVVVTDRGRAPNLAAVRELAVGVWNGGTAAADGELWIGDVRLAGASRQPGTAGQLTVGVQAGRLLRGEVTYAREGGHYRTFGGTPTYEQTSSTSMNLTLEAGRLLPASWGVQAPVTVRHRTSRGDPILLKGTDVPAELLPAVNAPSEDDWEVRMDLRRTLPARNAVAQALVDPLSLRLEWVRSKSNTTYMGSSRSGAGAVLAYEVRPVERSFPLLPGALFSRGGGSWVPRLRWTPTVLTVSQELVSVSDEQVRYVNGGAASPSPLDGPLHSRTRNLIQQVTVGVQPLPTLQGDVSIRSTRELQPPLETDSATAALIAREQWTPTGVPMGREALRSAVGQLTWTPRLSSWAQVEATVKSVFDLDQNGAEFGPAAPDDTAMVRLRSFANKRDATARLRIDPRALAGALSPVSTDTAAAARRGGGSPLHAVARVFSPIELGWGSVLESRYGRTAARPGLGYQMAWGGVDAFRAVGGDSAGSVSSATTWTARTQLNLPGAFVLGMAYDERRTEVLGLRNDRVETERGWPDLNLQWSVRRVPGVLGVALREASVSTGYRRRTLQRDDAAADHGDGTTSLAAPVRVSATWAGGIVTAYQMEVRRDQARTAAARVDQDGTEHTLTLGGRIPISRLAGGRPLEPLSLSLALRQADRGQCRITEAAPACSDASSFARYQDRTARLQAETRLSGTTFGLHADYASRRSQVAEISSVREFTVGMFAQFNVSLGQLPGLSP